MNLTKSDTSASAVRRVFEDYLLPLAKRLKVHGKRFFEKGFDPELNSYYSVRQETALTPESFRKCSFESQKDLERAFFNYWSHEGNEDLAVLAPILSSLAHRWRTEKEEQEAEVSPFIYVMF